MSEIQNLHFCYGRSEEISNQVKMYKEKEEEQKWRVRDNCILKKSEFFPYVSISFSVFIEHLIPSAIRDMYL